jgi:CysZ protein
MTTQDKTRSMPRRLLALPGALFAGGLYPFRSLALLVRTPRLWDYVLIPVILNLLVGIGLYAGLFFAGLGVIDDMVARLPQWLMLIEVVLQAILVVLLLIIIGFVLLRFGVVLGSPWYSRLSEQLEAMRLGTHPESAPLSVQTVAAALWDALLFEVKKVLLLVGLGAPLLLLDFFPPVGPILGTAGLTLLAATIIFLDFLDPPLSRRVRSFRARLGYLWRGLPSSASFSLVCLALVSIPLVNLLAIPVCVGGGTLFFCDRLATRADD